MNKKNLKITVKKGNSKSEFDRSDLKSVDESADGLVFETKQGFLLYYQDVNMTTAIKMKIKLTIDKMDNGNIVVDLNNYNNPVQFFAPDM